MGRLEPAVDEERLRKLVSEMRDAAESALDFWSTPEVRAVQIVEALEAAAGIFQMAEARRLETPPDLPAQPRR